MEDSRARGPELLRQLRRRVAPRLRPKPGIVSVLAFWCLVTIGLSARPGTTVIGPVLAEIRVDLGLSDSLAGVLTALPGLAFAVIGALTAPIGARLGLTGALTLALTLVTSGLFARAFVHDSATFIILTFVGISGIAISNVLVPPFIKAHFGLKTANMTALYAVLLAVGSTLPALTTGWFLGFENGWRLSVATWGLFSVVAVIPLTLLLLNERRAARTVTEQFENPDEEPEPELIEDTGSFPTVEEIAEPRKVRFGLLRSRTVVALMLFFGIQSLHAYVQFGWMAQMYRDGGLNPGTSAMMTAILLALGIPAGMVTPRLVARSDGSTWVWWVLGLTAVIGFLGILVFPTTLPWLWAFSLGVSSGSFPAAMTLINTLTRDHHVTMRVSAFVQSAGYLMAAIGPFLTGVILNATNTWVVPLLALSASGFLLILFGVVATKGGMIDDELDRARRSA